MPDIVEDMGRPLSYGLREADIEIEEDIRDAPDMAAAGLSFVQGSSMARGAALHPQIADDVTRSVCLRGAYHRTCCLTHHFSVDYRERDTTRACVTTHAIKSESSSLPTFADR